MALYMRVAMALAFFWLRRSGTETAAGIFQLKEIRGVRLLIISNPDIPILLYYSVNWA
jgi:hypothetical protein